ncbi:MAG: hypothetical protein ACRDO8_03060 [Nocardioidaceae bacterium]
MNDTQTWTIIVGMLAVMVGLLGIVSRFVHHDLDFAVDTLRAEIQALGHQLGGRIDAQGARIDAQGARIDAQGQELGARIDAQGLQIRSEMNERFAEVNDRFARVDARFDSLDRRIDGIDTDVQTLTRRFLGGGGAA